MSAPDVADADLIALGAEVCRGIAARLALRTRYLDWIYVDHSQYRSRCRECGGTIRIGEPIMWMRHAGAVHAVCSGWHP